MDVIASSKIEADSQLERLRRERGFEGHSQANPTLVSFLDRALDMYAPFSLKFSTQRIAKPVATASSTLTGT